MRELFARWRQARPEYVQFNEDGIVNVERWENIMLSKRTLFLLKETNDLNGSLAEFLRNGGNSKYYRTWNNVARWTEVLISGRVMEKVSRQELHDSLQQIAVMNVKKQAGNARARKEEIFAAASKDREFLQEEIQKINPSIIVTCGFEVVSICLHDYIFEEPDENWIQDKETGLWYYQSYLIRKNRKTLVISMPHPNRARKDYSIKLKRLSSRL